MVFLVEERLLLAKIETWYEPDFSTDGGLVRKLGWIRKTSFYTPLLVPAAPWEYVGMGFMLWLLRIQGHYSTSVLVNQFSKMGCFIPCRNTFDAFSLPNSIFMFVPHRFHLLPWDKNSSSELHCYQSRKSSSDRLIFEDLDLQIAILHDPPFGAYHPYKLGGRKGWYCILMTTRIEGALLATSFATCSL